MQFWLVDFLPEIMIQASSPRAMNEIQFYLRRDQHVVPLWRLRTLYRTSGRYPEVFRAIAKPRWRELEGLGQWSLHWDRGSMQVEVVELRRVAAIFRVDLRATDPAELLETAMQRREAG